MTEEKVHAAAKTYFEQLKATYKTQTDPAARQKQAKKNQKGKRLNRRQRVRNSISDYGTY